MALTINTILDRLKSDMEDKIDPTGNYSRKPTIKHGYYTQRDLKTDMPAVCFACYSEDLFETQSDDVASELFVRIYGFAKSDGIDSKDDVKELAHDVLYFLFSDDWYYYDKTYVISNIGYLEASPPQRPIGEFVFDIKIRHDGTYPTLRN